MSRIRTISLLPCRGAALLGPLIVALLAACNDQPAPLAPIEAATRAKGGPHAVVSPQMIYASPLPNAEGGHINTIDTATAPGGQRSLTTGAADRLPVYSPDYKKIAFVRSENSGYFVYVLTLSTGQLKLLGPGMMPRWSPDGKKIAFTRYVATDSGPDGEIFVMSPSGKNAVRLTTEAGTDIFPSWSADGKRITFASKRTGAFEIYTMNADGSAQTKITDCGSQNAQCSAPVWSPLPGDERIAYVYLGTLLGYSFGSVRLIESDGTDMTNVYTAVNMGRPAWSPDASRLAISAETSETPNNYEIYTINPDGTGLDRVTQDWRWDIDPAWSR